MQVQKDVWGLGGVGKKGVCDSESSYAHFPGGCSAQARQEYLCARSRAYREGCFHLGGFLTWGGQDSGVGGPTRGGCNSGMSRTNAGQVLPWSWMQGASFQV